MGIKNIAFEGAGVAGIAYAGAIRALREHDDLSELKNIAGTSVGAIMALMVALEYTDTENESVLSTFDSKTLLGSNYYLPNMWRLVNQYGYYSTDRLSAFIASILTRKFMPNNITFAELESMTETTLSVFALDATTKESKTFSGATTPNLSVVEAITASCSIPLFFTPKQIGDSLYVDGATVENYPIRIFDNTSVEDTLGLRIKVPHNMVSKALSSKKVKVDSLPKLIKQVIGAMMTHATNGHLDEDDHAKTIIVDVARTVSATDFDMSSELQAHLKHVGYCAIKAHYAKKV